jgi:hypothetical protein
VHPDVESDQPVDRVDGADGVVRDSPVDPVRMVEPTSAERPVMCARGSSNLFDRTETRVLVMSALEPRCFDATPMYSGPLVDHRSRLRKPGFGDRKHSFRRTSTSRLRKTRLQSRAFAIARLNDARRDDSNSDLALFEV